MSQVVPDDDDYVEKAADPFSEDPFFTFTMAEILEDQGHLDDALMIYRILSKRMPADGEINSKIKRLKKRARQVAGKRRRKEKIND